MSLLFLKAYWQLVRFDFYLVRGDFAVLYTKVRNHRVRDEGEQELSIDQICRAVDLACIWYRKQVLCLQRSAATSCLLRRHGVAATMVIGAQQAPFRAHAWVEVEGRVVNDKPHIPEIYAVLERC